MEVMGSRIEAYTREKEILKTRSRSMSFHAPGSIHAGKIGKNTGESTFLQKNSPPRLEEKLFIRDRWLNYRKFQAVVLVSCRLRLETTALFMKLLP